MGDGPERDFVGYGPEPPDFDWPGGAKSVGVHARWSGQPGRASALRDFIEYALRQPGARFMRRIDVAQFWTATFPPVSRPGPFQRPR
jgi:hypothetical protein